MSATEAQIRANRINARKSTGPRSEVGKARSRLNALKHGIRSKATPLVLPQEDPAELEARSRAWIDDYAPTNVVEHELVVRAARASWALDRAERYETALLSHRVRKAMVQSRARRTAKIGELGRKLLTLAGQGTPSSSSQTDDPAAIVAALEASPEGARWLLARWLELGCLIRSDQPWTFRDQYKFVRLLGKQPGDAVDDPELNAVFLTWEVVEPGWGVEFWDKMQEVTPCHDPAFNSWRCWRELVARPADPDAAVKMLTEIVDREIERLEGLAAELDEIEGDDAVELAERASFAADDAGERLRRFQTARARELLKTVEALARLRKEPARPEPTRAAAPEKSPNEAAASSPQIMTEQHDTPKTLALSTTKRTRPAAARSRPPVVSREGNGRDDASDGPASSHDSPITRGVASWPSTSSQFNPMSRTAPLPHPRLAATGPARPGTPLEESPDQIEALWAPPAET